MDESTQAERDRCLKILDAVMLEAPPDAQASLIRARNLIACGGEPVTLREQCEPPAA